MVQTASSTSAPSSKKIPDRKILQEWSQSQTNVDAHRVLAADAEQETLPTTPYPTKPAHILFPTPSSRGQARSSPFLGTPSPFRAKGEQSNGGRESLLTASRNDSADVSTIKRSVSELRNIYESQTAGPPSINHTPDEHSGTSDTSSSPALRDQPVRDRHSKTGSLQPSGSVRDWDLPGPPVTPLRVKKTQSELSLPPQPPLHLIPPVRQPPSSRYPSDFDNEYSLASSSPNIVTLASSPSNLHSIDDSSSPNFVLLGHSSSQDFHRDSHETDYDIRPLDLSSNRRVRSVPASPTNPVSSPRSYSLDSSPEATSSSPNLLSLGSSSPNYVVSKGLSSPDDSPGSFRTIQEAEHGKLVREQPSSSAFTTWSSSSSQKFNSSPPTAERSVESDSTLELPSMSDRAESSSDQHITPLRTHTNLQTALGSSPGPEIEYPLVKAPAMHDWENLHVAKRAPRLQREMGSSMRWNPRLSTVPSEWTDEDQVDSCVTLDAVDTADTSDTSDTISISEMPSPLPPVHRDLTSSTTRIRWETESRGAIDSVSDVYGSMLRNQSSGFLTVLSGISRNDSTKSIVLRTSASNGSLGTTVRFPAWARCYYARGFGDAFHFLRSENSNSSLSQRYLSSHTPFQHLHSPASNSSLSQTYQFTGVSPMPHIRREVFNPNPIQGQALDPILPQEDQITSAPPPPSKLIGPRDRPTKDARRSHLLPGTGPLVSNPSQARLSLPLDPADPRSHWAAAERAAIAGELQGRRPSGFRLPDKWSPHLYPDHNASARKHWLAPSFDEEAKGGRNTTTIGTARIFSRRNVQTIGFMVGFIFPFGWFVAAVLPLPPRPVVKEIGDHDHPGEHDPEAQGWGAGQVSPQDQLDYRTAVADEKRWANLRWWRTLNRFMSVVGLVVVVVVIVLAVVGTRGGF